jgi:hypothetical protein
MKVALPPPIPEVKLVPQPSVARWLAPILALAVGIGFGVMWGLNGGDLDHTGGTLVPIAFALIWASPGLIGLLANHRRPALFLGAALIELSLAPFTWSLAPLFFILGAMFLKAYARRSGGSLGRFADPVVAVLCAAGAFMSFAVLFMHDDPRSISTANSFESTSDVITGGEAAIALMIVAATITLAWFLSKPVSDA